jgi:hypothetical protein
MLRQMLIRVWAALILEYTTTICFSLRKKEY